MSAHQPPREHLVQSYTDDAFLARVAGEFLADGLSRREGAVVIATAPHVEALQKFLVAQGIDVLRAMTATQVVFLDARRTLDEFMVDGAPDRARFFAVIAAVLDRVRRAGFARVRAFGEMVDLLWGDNVTATIALEQLWNEVLGDERLSLLCAYRIDPFDRGVQSVLHQVTLCHSHILDDAEPDRFGAAVDRAYADVFGVLGDADALRRLVVDDVAADLPRMSPAHAALLGLRGVSPALADQVLTRGRAYYEAPETA